MRLQEVKSTETLSLYTKIFQVIIYNSSLFQIYQKMLIEHRSRSSHSVRTCSTYTSASASQFKQLPRIPSSKQFPNDFFGVRNRQMSCSSIRTSLKVQNLGFTFMASPKQQPQQHNRLELAKRLPLKPESIKKEPTKIYKSGRRYDLKKKYRLHLQTYT